jgi:hypothetical protein
MRGLGVTWSPESPACDAVKTRAEPGNPRQDIHKYSQMIASGKPYYIYSYPGLTLDELREVSRLRASVVKRGCGG